MFWRTLNIEMFHGPEITKDTLVVNQSHPVLGRLTAYIMEIIIDASTIHIFFILIKSSFLSYFFSPSDEYLKNMNLGTITDFGCIITSTTCQDS